MRATIQCCRIAAPSCIRAPAPLLSNVARVTVPTIGIVANEAPKQRYLSSSSSSSSSSEAFRPLPKNRFHASLAHPLARTWASGDTNVTASNMMYPIFISDDKSNRTAIPSLPGQYRWSVDRLPELIEPLIKDGLRSVLLFGVVDKARKDDTASWADHSTAPVPRALELLRKQYPSLLLAADLCLCGYTHHGHCGVMRADHTIDNGASIDRLKTMAVSFAKAGAHCIAPSDMMDGRIGAIKQGLSQNDLDHRVSVMAYSSKFASAFYGPFRDAACSGAQFGDRSTYQLAPGARDLAIRAAIRDADEGADMVMVKPGGPYLDIVRDVKDRVRLPMAIYQVSGEYAMLYHASQAGAFSLHDGVMESLIGMRRAGADILISYFTPQVLSWLKQPPK